MSNISSHYIHTNTQAQDFLDCISGPSSLYGLQPETLDSLVLSILPPLTHSYKAFEEPRAIDDSLDLKVLLMQELLQNLRHFGGLHILPVSDSRRSIVLLWMTTCLPSLQYTVDELRLDTDSLFDLVLNSKQLHQASSLVIKLIQVSPQCSFKSHRPSP